MNQTIISKQMPSGISAILELQEHAVRSLLRNMTPEEVDNSREFKLVACQDDKHVRLCKLTTEGHVYIHEGNKIGSIPVGPIDFERAEKLFPKLFNEFVCESIASNVNQEFKPVPDTQLNNLPDTHAPAGKIFVDRTFSPEEVEILKEEQKKGHLEAGDITDTISGETVGRVVPEQSPLKHKATDAYLQQEISRPFPFEELMKETSLPSAFENVIGNLHGFNKIEKSLGESVEILIKAISFLEKTIEPILITNNNKKEPENVTKGDSINHSRLEILISDHVKCLNQLSKRINDIASRSSLV